MGVVRGAICGVQSIAARLNRGVKKIKDIFQPGQEFFFLK